MKNAATPIFLALALFAATSSAIGLDTVTAALPAQAGAALSKRLLDDTKVIVKDTHVGVNALNRRILDGTTAVVKNTDVDVNALNRRLLDDTTAVVKNTDVDVNALNKRLLDGTTAVVKNTDVDVNALNKRSGKTARCNNLLSVKVLAAVKAQVKASVTAKITARVIEDLKAGITVSAKVLGGLVTVDDLKIQAAESAHIKKLEVDIDAHIKAKVDAEVEAAVKVALGKCNGRRLSAADLLKLAIDIETAVYAKLKVDLPKIAADLTVYIKAAIDASVKGVAVNIPILLTAKLDSTVKVDVCVKAAVNLAISACADVDVKVAAQALVNAL